MYEEKQRQRMRQWTRRGELSIHTEDENEWMSEKMKKKRN